MAGLGCAIYSLIKVFFLIMFVCVCSGHRIGTAEVESALVLHPAVAQAAVVGKAHPIKGEAIVGFVTLQVTHEESPELLIEVRILVHNGIWMVALFATIVGGM